MHKPSFDWFSTRWFEFRHGYATYMVFLFGFSNFILILYNFIPQFKELLDLHYFAISVFSIIVPCAVLVGRWHHKKHLPVESKVSAKYYAYRDKIVPHSKENFQANHIMFTTSLSKWQTSIAKQQMMFFNIIMDKLDIPKEHRFTAEIEQADDWSEQLDGWNDRWRKYNEGADASGLVT